MKRRAFLAAGLSLAGAAFADQICFAKNAPFYAPPSGSVGEGGLVTLDSPLTLSDPAGWCYFPDGIAFTDAVAGWYWTAFSSPISGTVYASNYRGGANIGGSLVMNNYANMGMGTRTFSSTPVAPANTSANGINLVIEGDSITRAIAASSPAFSYQGIMLPQYTHGEVSLVHDFAVGGSTVSGNPGAQGSLYTRAPSVDLTYRPDRLNIILAWCGTNDLRIGTYGTWSDILAALATYCAQRRALGFKVVVATMLPRSRLTPPNFEADRQSYNSKMRATWWQFADALADVAADDRIGAPGAQLNTTYYLYDQTHPVDAGYEIIAPIFKAAIDRLL